MLYDELLTGLSWVQRVVDYKGLSLELELVWVFDDYYVNVWSSAGNCLESHLSSRGDFEAVWEWLKETYPHIDWDEQDF